MYLALLHIHIFIQWGPQRNYGAISVTYCVKSRKIEDLNAEIHEGYMSTSMMLMGNIAYRKKIDF